MAAGVAVDGVPVAAPVPSVALPTVALPTGGSAAIGAGAGGMAGATGTGTAGGAPVMSATARMPATVTTALGLHTSTSTDELASVVAIVKLELVKHGSAPWQVALVCAAVGKSSHAVSLQGALPRSGLTSL